MGKVNISYNSTLGPMMLEKEIPEEIMDAITYRPENATFWNVEFDQSRIKKAILVKKGMRGSLCGILAIVSPNAHALDPKKELDEIAAMLCSFMMKLNMGLDDTREFHVHHTTFNTVDTPERLRDDLCIFIKLKSMHIDVVRDIVSITTCTNISRKK